MFEGLLLAFLTMRAIIPAPAWLFCLPNADVIYLCISLKSGIANDSQLQHLFLIAYYCPEPD